MDLRRFCSWTSVVDEERPSMDTVQRPLSVHLWLCLVDIGRPRPIWPPPLPRPRPDTTTYTNARCERNCPAWGKIWKMKNSENTKWTIFCIKRHFVVLMVHSAGWRGTLLFLSTKINLKKLCVFLSHLSRHIILSCDWLIIFLHRTSMSEHDACGMAYLHMRSWLRGMFLQLQSVRGGGERDRRDPEKRKGRGNVCVSVRVCGCVGGGGAKGRRAMQASWWLPYPVSISEYGNCDSSLVVTGVQKGQGTLCSLLCYTAFSLSILLHLAYCPVLSPLPLDWCLFWIPG